MVGCRILGLGTISLHSLVCFHCFHSLQCCGAKSNVILIPDLLSIYLCESKFCFYFSSLEAVRKFSLFLILCNFMMMCLCSRVLYWIIASSFKSGKSCPCILGNFLNYFFINFFPSTDCFFLSETFVFLIIFFIFQLTYNIKLISGDFFLKLLLSGP